MENSLVLSAPAKINWSLEILGRRPDGYHLLRSIMQQIDLADRVTLTPAAEDHCFCGTLPEEEKLAFRDWKRLKAQAGLKQCLEIRIEKNIPIGAGLAGGSTDAAAVLRGAARLFDLPLSEKDLLELGLALGADLPFCLTGGACLVEGVCERLSPLPRVRDCFLVLANPGFPVSTPQVYQAHDRWGSDAQPDWPGLQQALEQNPSRQASLYWGNQLQAGAVRLHEELTQVERHFLDQGLRPLMSGSGGTFFACCESEQQAKEAAKALNRVLPWAAAARTLSTPLCGR